MTTSSPATIIGIVKTGHGQGGKLGAKTANLEVRLAQSLTKGLYECEIELDQRTFSGLLYYGINSLTNTDCLEVHLLNFNGELVGREIEVVVGKYLRGEKKFDSNEDLAAQIRTDLDIFSK